MHNLVHSIKSAGRRERVGALRELALGSLLVHSALTRESVSALRSWGESVPWSEGGSALRERVSALQCTLY